MSESASSRAPDAHNGFASSVHANVGGASGATGVNGRGESARRGGVRRESRAAGATVEPTRESNAGSSLMTAEKVAERLGGVSVKWVWAQTRAGKIPHVRLGRLLRYRPEKIDSWLAEIERGGE